MGRVEDKMAKALGAKTAKSRANYLIDALFDDEPVIDEALHFLVEGGVKRWAKKMLRYKLKL